MTIQGTAVIDNPPALAQAAPFEELVARHQAQVTRLAFRLLGWRGDVDDVVQEVFLAALKHGPRFRGESSVATWLTRITINKCRSHQRRRHLWWRLFGRAAEPDTQASSFGAPVGDALAGVETSAKVRAAVQALPARDREVVVLRYFENLSFGEIGAATGASTNAVEVRLHRARARLAEALRDLSHEDQRR